MGTVQTGIRMDEELYARLKRIAKKQNRSLNNYVVTLLEEATAPVFPHVERKTCNWTKTCSGWAVSSVTFRRSC